MSSIVARSPVAATWPPQRWSVRGLFRTWRARRKAQEVWVVLLHAADLYPPG